jgi:hypothetical protein
MTTINNQKATTGVGEIEPALHAGRNWRATRTIKPIKAIAFIVITASTLSVVGCSHLNSREQSKTNSPQNAVEANINDRSTWVDPIR